MEKPLKLCLSCSWLEVLRPVGSVILLAKSENLNRNPTLFSINHQWGLTAWFLSDSKLTARDKALVAFGASAAGRCQYWTPFHTEQLRLSGIDDDQIQEACYAALQSAGFSAYLHGIGYSLSRWLEELSGAVEYIKRQSG